MSFVLGAVAYDPKVVTIWTSFRDWFRRNDVDFDYVLYSHYERQVEDLLEGRLHVAWNLPLAWIRAERLAAARNSTVQALAMRDTDRDLTSVIVVGADSPVRSIEDLQGKIVGVGAVDSPQARLLPLAYLEAAGVSVSARWKSWLDLAVVLDAYFEKGRRLGVS
jgi:ABC-type phosphate/phosphonate transport system substrate-binding protein